MSMMHIHVVIYLLIFGVMIEIGIIQMVMNEPTATNVIVNPRNCNKVMFML